MFLVVLCKNSGKKIKFGLDARVIENLTRKVMLKVSLETKQSVHMDKIFLKIHFTLKKLAYPHFLFSYFGQWIDLFHTIYCQKKKKIHCNSRIIFCSTFCQNLTCGQRKIDIKLNTWLPSGYILRSGGYKNTICFLNVLFICRFSINLKEACHPPEGSI